MARVVRAFPVMGAIAAAVAFNVIGNRIYDDTGAALVFKGIGMTCTEYMTRPNMPLEEGLRGPGFRVEGGRVLEDWPGSFAWNACFCGAPAPNATLAVNNETSNMLAYLLPDSSPGGTFITSPVVNKVPFGAPYDAVVNTSAVKAHPIIRIPVTASSYLYTCDDNQLGAAGYRQLIDLLVQFFTSHGVAVIIDLHTNCAGGSKLNCVRDGPMALRMYGNVTGAAAFWDLVAATYASNPLVLYELYNEPHVWYQAYYGGDPLYIGMAELYNVVRNHTPSGLVIVGGHDQYSQDAAGSVALWMQYARDYGSVPVNLIFNLHPYQGAYQGLEHSLRSTMRLTLALQTMAPVIYTELGQYCCDAFDTQGCQSPGMCIDHAHGDWFVHNLINMAAQYDVSWVGWAWRGSNANGGNCSQGEAICNSPDMRGVGGTLTNGSAGGANWAEVWATYVSSPVVNVQDNGDPSRIGPSDYEVQGFLPRPCIVPGFNMGAFCGFPLGTNISTLPWNSMWNQTVFESVLPGLPPFGIASCLQQSCPGYPACNTSSPIVPMPQPCAAAAV